MADAAGEVGEGAGAARGLHVRGRRTRARLLDAGLEVLAARGYHAARVDDVVRAARTSHGTFYLYFSDKDDLVRSLAEGCVREVTEVVGELGAVGADRSGRDELREWLARWNDAYRRYGPVVRVWMEDHVPDPALMKLGGRAMGEILKVLEHRIREAGSRHVEPALAAPAMLAMIERIFYYVLSRSIPVDEDAMLDTLATMIHRGFFAGDGGA